MVIESIPLPAKLIGFAGLVPFMVLAFLVCILPDPVRLLIFDILVHYAAVILSFIGAVHWGSAMAVSDNARLTEKYLWRRFGWSVVPALAAWLATQMVLSVSLLTLILGFVFAFIFDCRSAKRGEIPTWYIKLRKSLTLVVVASLSGALMQSIFGPISF